METFTYNAVIEPIEEGYLVTVPALSGCSTWGRTYDEAVAMAKDAIEGYILVLKKHGDAIPVEAEPPMRLGIQVKAPVLA